MRCAPRTAVVAAHAARALMYAALLAACPLVPAARAVGRAHSTHDNTARAIRCAGAGTMQALIARWAQAFGRRQPGRSVTVDSRVVLSADGLTALLAGRADCVTYAREMFPAEVAAYEAHFGVLPRPIPIARGS
ncbi:MAG TPA: hypothetical protein VMU86_05720, partial [Steroidobacteraceae bacterium]|nr:hypothetical protein [Steroidobacteraceae bacterium]